MNQLAPHEPTLPGLLPNVEALVLANSFGVIVEGHETLVTRMPTATERQVLHSRAEALMGALTPIGERRADQAEAASVIAAMLVGYNSARKDKAAAETVTVYLEHLKTIPLFAIKAACEDVKAGRVYDVDRRTGNRIPLDPDFPPSTIRLRSVAQKHIDAMSAEKYRFDRVLRAKRALPPPIPEAERAAVAQKFLGLKADLERAAAGDELEENKRKARIAGEHRARTDQLILGEYAALGIEPVRNDGMLVSPALARKLGGLRGPKRTDNLEADVD